MTKQTLFLALVSSLLVAASGCGVVHALVCDPFGTGYRAPCEPCHNGVACGGTTCQGNCDAPVCRHPVRNWLTGDRPCGYPGACGATCGGACGEPCGGCGEPCGTCGDCAEPCDGCGCHHFRPFAWFLGLFHPATCGCSGCGERYWGEWVNDRPDCHDPCDCHGNFIAGSQGFAGYGPNGPLHVHLFGNRAVQKLREQSCRPDLSDRSKATAILRESGHTRRHPDHLRDRSGCGARRRSAGSTDGAVPESRHVAVGTALSPFAPRKQRYFRGAKGDKDLVGRTKVHPTSCSWPIRYHIANRRTSLTPCRGTGAEYRPSNSPASCCRQRSRTRCVPCTPRSAHFAVTTPSTSPRLNSPTAFEPSSMSLAQTSSSPSFATRWACSPRGSRFTSKTSSLVSKLSVNRSSRVMSPLKIKGAAIRDQSVTCVYCSFGVSGVGFILPSHVIQPTRI